MTKWAQLLADPSPDAWAALRARVLGATLHVDEFEKVHDALAHWPPELRALRGTDLNGRGEDPERNDRVHAWTLLCRRGPAINPEQLRVLGDAIGLVESPNHRHVIDHLCVHDEEGDVVGPILARFWGALSVRSLRVDQCFSGDALGAALYQFKHLLQHLEVDINGYEPYVQTHGLDPEKPVSCAALRVLAIDYYPLFSGALPALTDAHLPQLEALNLPLVPGGALRRLLDAPWFRQLHTLRLRLTEHPDSHDTSYLEWLDARCDGYDRGSDRMADGSTRTDDELRVLASSPSAASLRRLAIDGDAGPAGVAALCGHTQLHALEELWITGAGADDARSRLAAAFPSASVHVGGGSPWSGWSERPEGGAPLHRDTEMRLRTLTYQEFSEEEVAMIGERGDGVLNR